MSKNVLEQGKPRLGWLFDGDSSTDDLGVMLEDTGEQIVLTVPTKGIFGTYAYDRWFMSGIRFGDDPDKTKYTYKPPETLMFADSAGPVVLVGCRAIGSTAGMNAGTGRIVPNAVVFGAEHLNYGRIHGMRSEVPALAAWSRQKSVHAKPVVDSDGRVQKVDVALDSPPEIPLARALNLTMRPTWRTSGPDSAAAFAAHDIVQLSTSAKDPRSWQDHLELHVAIRNLLQVASWIPLGFDKLYVNRLDDPARVLTGQPISERWAEATSHHLRKHTPWKREPQFLFAYDDIGASGIRRWLKLRRHFARAIQPLVGIIDAERQVLDTKLVQSGVALEALGYQLAVDAGGSQLNSRGQLSYADALRLVLDDLKMCPLHDRDDWIRRSRDSHSGLKHADRQIPDLLDLANTLRENLLVMRVWIASRLGCDATTLTKRVERDPMAQEYLLLD